MFRVWDSLLAEGSKVLFRVALAVLMQSEAALLDKADVGELCHEIQRCGKRFYDADSLLKVSPCGSLRFLTARRRRPSTSAASPRRGFKSSATCTCRR